MLTITKVREMHIKTMVRCQLTLIRGTPIRAQEGGRKCMGFPRSTGFCHQ